VPIQRFIAQILNTPNGLPHSLQNLFASRGGPRQTIRNEFRDRPRGRTHAGQTGADREAAFAGYVAGWSEQDAVTLARFLHLQGADLFHSRFVRVVGELAGFGYINRTGDIPRLAAMAMLPAARGNGAADYLLQHLLDESRARGDAAICGNSCVVISDPAITPLRVHALLSASAELAELRGALVLPRFPERELFMPPVFPEAFGAAVFQPLKLEREALSQFLMRREV
jgi:GNAT superfamily N-acetyltransferase